MNWVTGSTIALSNSCLPFQGFWIEESGQALAIVSEADQEHQL